MVFFSSSRLADGKTYKGFHIAGEGAYEGKIVGVDATGNEYRPYDFSITKNAFSVMISGTDHDVDRVLVSSIL